MSGMDFSKWLNNEYLPNNPDNAWIKEVSSKAVKQSIMNAERAFRRFFNGVSGFPKFKKKSKSDVKMYLNHLLCFLDLVFTVPASQIMLRLTLFL